MTNTITLSVGKMPGRLTTIAVEAGSTVKQALEIAGVAQESGFEIKVDGTTVTQDAVLGADAKSVLLVAQVKGNADTVVQIGKMPGRLNTYALTSDTTYKQAFEVAGITDYDGFEVKADGTTITNLDSPIGTPVSILLTAKVKGNK